VVERLPSLYDTEMALYAEKRRRADEGRVLIKAADQPWETNRQGRLRYYLHEAFDDTAVDEWKLFSHSVHTPSGKHRHQGGLAIYVKKGRGWTVVNGERFDWKAGDLVLLPVTPGGCEHQHFKDPEFDGETEWVAFIYLPWFAATGSDFEQREDRVTDHV
jgi:hypothetical protein